MKKGRPSMKISKEEFPKHLSAYTEDEKFYRDVYLHEKEHPETFKEYLDTLDPEYISRHRLYVPGISASFLRIPYTVSASLMTVPPLTSSFVHFSVYLFSVHDCGQPALPVLFTRSL